MHAAPATATAPAIAPDASDVLIPLVIGVTGHRNPDPSTVPHLEAEVERVLRQLDERAPGTPFVLLAPLARGCDRIAARVALRFRRRRPGMGVRVVAPLPLPLDDYRRDFAADAADAAEFEAMLGQVDEHFELPLPHGLERHAVLGGVAGTDRDRCYRRLGLYIAVQSQVMIAMWDGVRTGAVGGTGEIVDFCRGHRRREPDGGFCAIPFRHATHLLAPADETVLAWIPTQREHAPPPAGALDQAWLCGLQRLLASLEDLNDRLEPVPPGGYVPPMLRAPAPPAVDRAWSRMRNRFLALDELSKREKAWVQRGAAWIPTLFVLAVVAFQWFAGFGASRAAIAWIPLAVYVGLLVAAATVWWMLKRRHRTEWRFVHARALSEAMRVELAWAGSGIDKVAADMYIARRSGDVHELRLMLRAATWESAVVRARGGAGGGTSRGCLWVDEQAGYFEGKSVRACRRRAAAWRLTVRVLKALIMALSLLLLGMATFTAAGLADIELEGWIANLCFLVAVSLAVTVGLSYWQHVTLDGELIETADRMLAVFKAAQDQVREHPDWAKAVIDAAGKEALDEHAEWFEQHRDRLELPELG
jgi:hypothetical protein